MTAVLVAHFRSYVVIPSFSQHHSPSRPGPLPVTQDSNTGGLKLESSESRGHISLDCEAGSRQRLSACISCAYYRDLLESPLLERSSDSTDSARLAPWPLSNCTTRYTPAHLFPLSQRKTARSAGTSAARQFTTRATWATRATM